MKVICISGKAQHGKDTTATLIKQHLEDEGHSVLVIHYADPVKFICEKYFGWDGKKDEYGRSLLQMVGTDVVRAQEPDYWVNFVESVIRLFKDEWDYALIPDCRFPNEVDKMKDEFGAVHVRVVRPNFDNGLTKEQKEHASETSLDDYVPDYTLENTGSIEGLEKAITDFLKEVVYE